MKVSKEKFYEDIFTFEALRILDDIEKYTCLNSLINDFTEDKKAAAIKYIVGVFKECLSVGDLDVLIDSDSDVLKGYALLFVLPQYKSTYLHSIFVVKQFRNKGVGTKLLNKIKDHELDAYLLCDYQKIGYYEKNGFKYVNKVYPPTGDNFKISQYLYHSLSIMTVAKHSREIPIFYFNDQDLRIITGLNDADFHVLADLQHEYNNKINESN
jgi:GNAT superfamily N-acetyltransferase